MSRADRDAYRRHTTDRGDTYGRPDDTTTDRRPMLGDTAYDELARAMFAGFAYMQAAGGGTTPTADALSGAIAVMEEALAKPSVKDTKALRRDAFIKFGRIGDKLTQAELGEIRAKVKPGDTSTALEYEDIAALVYAIPKTAKAEMLKELIALFDKLDRRIYGDGD